MKSRSRITNSDASKFPEQAADVYVRMARYPEPDATATAYDDGSTTVLAGGETEDYAIVLTKPSTAVNDTLNNQVPGTAATVPNILGNDINANGGTLSPDSISLVAPSGATGITTDAQGDVTGFTVPGQGTWTLNSSTGQVTFTPQSGFTSDPTPISYTVTDAAGLTSNPATITVDYKPTVAVSGTAYNDNNGTIGGANGTALSGATVKLYASDGTTVLATTTTDASGNYSFPNQIPGNYIVGITAPSGYSNVSSTDATPTDGKTSVTVGSTAVTGVNFGLNQPPTATGDALSGQAPGSAATISNLLGNDTDPNSGTLSPDSISLVAPSGATGITTDAQGDVTGFTVPGQGTWALNSSTGALTFTPQSGFTGDPTAVVYTVTDAAGLTSSPATATIDYNAPVAVSGTLYSDSDGTIGGANGTVLPGAEIKLYASNGTTVLATAWTDNNGNYSFPNLVPGSYIVAVSPIPGRSNVSSTDATPTDGKTSVTVGSTAVTGVNFGTYTPPVATNDALSGQTPGSAATITNLLGNDSEPYINGILSPDSISLVAPTGATGITTDAQGDVTGFTVPGQGTWALNSSTGALTFTPQSGFTGDPTAISYTVTNTSGLASNPATATIDYNPPVTVSGTVYNDNNGLTGGANGTPLAGVSVQLWQGNTLLGTTTTDANGNYSFPNQVPGNYVMYIGPSQLPAGFQNVSTSTPASSDLTRVSYTVGSTAVTGVNFGLNKPPTATNDALSNQSPGSPATITNLLGNDTDPNGGTLLPGNLGLATPPAGATGVTSNGGATTGFTIPGEGTWALNTTTGSVTFTPQAGFTGDPTPIQYGVKDSAGLWSNMATLTIDYNPTVAVSGTAYNDNNGTTGGANGTVLSGATVKLYASDGTTVLATTTTDASGNYSFPNQVPGNYIVGITAPSGYSNVSSTDATPTDGKTSVTVGSTAVTGVNFGLNQPPVATNDALSNQSPGSPATITNLLGNDTDPNGGTLLPGNLGLASPPVGATGVTNNGSATTGFAVPGEGTWALNTTTGSITFTPQAGFTGDPTPIRYGIKDSAGLWSNLATLTIDYNPPVAVSGTAYNDNNGTTGGANGTALSGATVKLYASDGTTVLATTTTDASGNYSFPNQIPGNYIVGITAPSGYSNVSSTDATPTDGKTSVTVGSAAVTGVNFGLNQPPTTINDALSNQAPGSAATISNLLGNDSDPNSGTLSPDSISLVAPSGATGITTDAQGDVTGFTVPGEGTWALNSSTGSLTFTPQNGYTGSPTAIIYKVTDGAGLTSNPATVTITYNPPVTVSGTLYSDDNGMIGGVNGNGLQGAEIKLYASNGTTVLATRWTDANGNYSFPNLVPGNYIVAVSPISGRSNVSSTDATPTDGKTTVTVGSTAVTGVNFGTYPPPVAANDALSNQPPGSAATISNLLGNDSEPYIFGTLSPDSISLVAPTGATGITTDAQGDVTGFTVPGQGTWALNSSTGALTFTPQSGFTGDPTAISYTVTNTSGLASNPATATIDYNPPVTLSGTLYSDSDGTIGGANGTVLPGAEIRLYASNGTTVLATRWTDVNGNYSFPNLVPGNYIVAVSPISGRSNVSSTDATPTDGKTTVTVGSTAVTGVNFGTYPPPVAANDALSNQPPGSAATISNLLGNDSEPYIFGTLSPDSISLVAPTGATGITTDAQGDVTGFTVPGQGTWALNSSTGALTFTPQSGFTGDPTAISYTVTNTSGLASNPATATIDYNPPVTVSGTLYSDANGTIGGANGNGLSGAEIKLYASDGTTVLSTRWTDVNGNYSFANLVPGSYIVAVSPIPGRSNVSSTDATPTDGKTTVTVGSTAVTGVNFGTYPPPVAANDALSNQAPGSAATISNLLGNDSEPSINGTLSPDSISLVAPSGATGITTDAQGDVTGFTVPGQGTWALNSSTGALTFTPQSGFTGDPTPISYTVTNTAGLTSNPATATIDYNPPVAVSGTAYNDNNGAAGGANGTALSGATVTLYAADGTTVLATTTTDASGNYSFPNQVPGNYIVGITAPSGYSNVSSTDATPADGRTSVTVGSTAITGVNFGLNQPPVAANNALDNQPAGLVATLPNLLANDSDPNGGTLSTDSISLVAPTGATNIQTDAQGDITGFTVPGQGVWSLNSSTGALTFTPQSGYTGSPTPVGYTVTDNAGLTSNTATATINYVLTPDLTPTIALTLNQLAVGTSRDFVVQLKERRQVATSGAIAINITVPTGYTLSFSNTATSVLVLPSTTYSVSNTQWTAFVSSPGNINLQSQAGFSIGAGGNTRLSFKLTRTSALQGSQGNITVSIFADAAHTYDSVTPNNLYSRIIAAN